MISLKKEYWGNLTLLAFTLISLNFVETQALLLNAPTHTALLNSRASRLKRLSVHRLLSLLDQADPLSSGVVKTVTCRWTSMSPTQQVLSLYRNILKAAEHFPSRKRAQIIMGIKEEFRANKVSRFVLPPATVPHT